MSGDGSKRSREELLAKFRGMQDILPKVPLIPSLNLPKVDLPYLDLGFPTAEMTRAAESWNKAMRPLTEIGERISRQMEAVNLKLGPVLERLQWLEEHERQCSRIEEAGWLPHASSPYELVDQAGDDLAALDQAIDEHYRRDWQRISAVMLEEIQACDLDQEAKDTFGEALAAHGYGLYRCAPRLLYPEIERVSRIELHGGALDKMASQQRLVQAIGGLTPAEMASTGVAGLRFYKKLTEHLYLHLKDPSIVEAARADPVPNRHAAIHGLVSYTSAKSSLNAILVADYLLQAVSTIKALAREGAP